VTIAGKVVHEFSIGDENEQKAHQDMMKKILAWCMKMAIPSRLNRVKPRHRLGSLS